MKLISQKKLHFSFQCKELRWLKQWWIVGITEDRHKKD